jgi:hypothetical protein
VSVGYGVHDGLFVRRGGPASSQQRSGGKGTSTEAEAGLPPHERTGNGLGAGQSWHTTSRVHGNGRACPRAEGLSNNALQQTSGAARMDAARS